MEDTGSGAPHGSCEPMQGDSMSGASAEGQAQPDSQNQDLAAVLQSSPLSSLPAASAAGSATTSNLIGSSGTGDCDLIDEGAVIVETGSPIDPLVMDNDECLSDDSNEVVDALIKGACDPDDNLPKPKRFRSRMGNRSRAGSRLSASATSANGSNSDVGSGFGSHLSFRRPLTKRQPSTMSKVSRASHVSRVSAKSGTSMLSRASGTSVMSQLTTPESCGFLHISNDVGSMLGSAIMLTSPSYLDVFHSSYLNLADQLQLPLDDELSPMDGGLTKIAEEPEDFDSLAEEPADAGVAIPLQTAGETKATAQLTQSLCYKRVISMAFTFFFVYSAFFSLRNVQSSLSKDPLLGLLSLGCLYALPWLGAVCSYPIMHRIRPKWTMVCATVPYLLFAISNFHAVSYIALPASLVQGFGLGLIWAAEGLYMVNTASTYAIVNGMPLNQAIGKFNSIFYAIYQSSNVVGNGLSSLILQSVFPGEDEQTPPLAPVMDSLAALNDSAVLPGLSSIWANDSIPSTTPSLSNATIRTCGILFDFGQKLGQSAISSPKKYTLLSVMTFMATTGVLVAIFLVKRLDVAHLTGARNVFVSFRNMLKIIIDPRMLLLFPVFVYFGFSGSLMFGDYAKAFISCRYGASKIGLVFLTGAAVGVLGSLASGYVATYTGRAPVILVAGLVASGAYITMLFWTPPEGGVSFLLFLPVVMWCFSDGILSSQINGFQGFLFQEKLPSACAAYLLCYGCSVALGTMTAAFEWITLQTKAYLVIGMQVTALTSYIFIEGLLRRGVLQQG